MLRGPLSLATRALARRPGFTAAVALTLGLGVGANVAVFSLVDAGLLRALPYPDADRLVLAWEARPDRGWNRFGVSGPAFRSWRREVASLEQVVAFYEAQANVEGPAGAERVNVLYATADLLPALRLRPHLGRGLEPADERPEAPAALLGFGFWQSAFGGDPAVLGRSLRVGRESVTVVGVLPGQVGAPFARPAIVRPLAVGDDSRRGARWLTVLARVVPGRAPSLARAELEGLALRHAQEFPDTNAGWTVTVVGLPEAAREDGRLTLLLLSGAVGLVLVLACANVAGLLLVRTLGRERELAIRAALGAGPWGLAQPVLAEALAVGLLGGAVGLVFAVLGLALLRPLVPPSSAAVAAVDGRTLAAALAFALLTAVLVALLPVAHAWRAGRTANATLRAGGSSVLTPGRRRSRRALVAAEVAIAFVLLASASVLLRAVRGLLDVDPGFRAEGAIAFRVAPPQVPPAAGQSEEAFFRALLEDRDRAAAFYERLLDRLRALPGVSSVAAVNRLPLTGGWWVIGYEVAGHAPAGPGESQSAFGRVVTPGYFETMGQTLRAGRAFDAGDASGTRAVVVVDETLARREFGGRSPLGALFRIDGETEATVVGVVSATRVADLDRPAPPVFYVPMAQARFGFYPDWGMDVVVRAAGDPRGLTPSLRRTLRELDPALPAFAVRTLDGLVREALGPRRDVLGLLGVFSLLALVLAAVGLYGLLAQLARERSREFGVRLALGARPSEVGALVFGEGLRLAAAGGALGLVGALFAGRALASLLHEVSPRDPVALGGAALLLAATAAAVALPSVVRSARLDPAAVLRDE
jgi:predicted permease